MIDGETVKKAGTLVGAVATIIGAGWAVFTFADQTYAKRPDVILVEQRLDQKIVNDKYDRLKEREWRYQEKYGDKLEKANTEVKEEYRQIRADRERAEQQLKAIAQKLLEKK